MRTIPTTVLLCLMFLADVPSVFPSPLSASHNKMPSPPSPPALQGDGLLHAFILQTRDSNNATKEKRKTRWDEERLLHRRVLSNLFHSPFNYMRHPSSGSQDPVNIQTGGFARRTRHISMPRCGSLRNRCRRIPIRRCYNMCVNNVVKYVCRLPNTRNGRPLCSVRPRRM